MSEVQGEQDMGLTDAKLVEITKVLVVTIDMYSVWTTHTSWIVVHV